MSTRPLMAALAGGVTALVLGTVLYGILLMDFFNGNLGSATGVYKEIPIWWALIAGQLLWAGLLTLVLGWRGQASAGAGLKTGALFGLIMGASINLTLYGTSNIANLTATLVDPLVSMVGTAITGAVIGAVLGMGRGAVEPATARRSPAPSTPPATEHTEERSAGM